MMRHFFILLKISIISFMAHEHYNGDSMVPAGLHQLKSEMAQPNYTKLSENLRRVTPTHIQCSMFCGGRRCKYENATSWKPEQMAIEGLYSHWITDEILAMARPSTDLINKRKIIQQFKNLGINTVINLQLAGEHSSCGSALEESGFTYDPNVFMQNNIYFYNFGWKDYGEATLTSLLDMVKVMAFAVSEGKVAIHCHAGLGRTGVLIACYLVYNCRVRANDAIRFVRLKRPNAVQTRGQILCVQEFEQFVLPQCIVFCNKEFVAKDKKVNEFTLAQYLSRQKIILHGYDVRAFKYIPKIIYLLCERMIRLCGGESLAIGSVPFTRHFISTKISPERHQVGFGRIGSGDSNISSSAGSTRRASLDCELPLNLNGSQEEETDDEGTSSANAPLCVSPDMPSCASGLSGLDDSGLDAALADGIKGQELHENECYQELNSQIDLRRAAKEETVKPLKCEDVADALQTDYHLSDEHLRKQIRQLRIELNHRQSTWVRMYVEPDVRLLSALLFEWLEHLKTPILSKDDLSHVVVLGAKPEMCLKKFEVCLRYTLEYLIRFVARLPTLGRSQQVEVLKRIAASLTHQAVTVRGSLQPSGKNFQKLREGTLKKVVEFLTKLLELVEEHPLRDNLGSRASLASAT